MLGLLFSTTALAGAPCPEEPRRDQRRIEVVLKISDELVQFGLNAESPGVTLLFPGLQEEAGREHCFRATDLRWLAVATASDVYGWEGGPYCSSERYLVRMIHRAYRVTNRVGRSRGSRSAWNFGSGPVGDETKPSGLATPFADAGHHVRWRCSIYEQEQEA